MAGEADQTFNVLNEPIIDENKSPSGAESNVLAASSSSNEAATKMANKTSPSMSDYWKKSTITDADCSAYHATGWLGGGMEFHVPEVDIPMVDGSTLVYFKYHLVIGLGLPPSKFLVAIMNFLGRELVHLNSNAIAALSCFTMICECWLGIASNTSLFWYFYSPIHYDKVIYSGIGLSLRRNRRKNYIDATFKSP
jgi:hypothetical protein